MLIFVVLAACGSSSDTCSQDEVEVHYLGGGPLDGTIDCAPIPASCGATGSCADNTCIRDMYALCDSRYIGVGCSDTFQPVIISCNP